MIQQFYSRKVTRFSVFTLILLCIVLGLTSLEFGEAPQKGQFRFTVRIQHFGVDAEEMERSITKPLENLLGDIPGIYELRSSSELNTSRVDIILQDASLQREVFFSLRDSVDELYSSLPGSVQRPQIFSSSGNDKPLMILSFPKGERSLNLLRNVIDRDLKPRLENLEEAGEVEVGGGTPLEIHVNIYTDRLDSTGLNSQSVSSIVQLEYGRLQAGVLNTDREKTTLSFDARIADIQGLRGLYIPRPATEDNPSPGGLKLGQIADVQYGEKEFESISRVSGNEHVVVYIKSSGNGSPVSLSYKVRTILEDFTFARANILYDYGDTLDSALKKLIISLLLSIAILVLFLLIMFRDIRLAALLSGFILLSLLLTVAIFSLFQRQISIGILTGLGIGIGLIADAAIILVIAASKSIDRSVKLFSAIIASTITTLIALIPLLFIPDTPAVLLEMATAFSGLLVTSVLLAILFLPPLAMNLNLRSVLPKTILFPNRYLQPKMQILIFLLLVSLVPIIFIIIPQQIQSQDNEQVLFAQLEYPSGTHIDYIDEKMQDLSMTINSFTGVERVETFARRTNGTLSIRYNEKEVSRELLSAKIDELNDSLFEGFIFLNEGSSAAIQVSIDLIGPR
jgi:multidrug efflux pump subunit AcrB